ncbi:MAG: hypothetical protein K2X27_00015 [Candidatus Obscuribacterales bacterium]|nr:hypothetical protein [Candidatus Obscuribacterales bacterium]
MIKEVLNQFRPVFICLLLALLVAFNMRTPSMPLQVKVLAPLVMAGFGFVYAPRWGKWPFICGGFLFALTAFLEFAF